MQLEDSSLQAQNQVPHTQPHLAVTISFTVATSLPAFTLLSVENDRRRRQCRRDAARRAIIIPDMVAASGGDRAGEDDDDDDGGGGGE